MDVATAKLVVEVRDLAVHFRTDRGVARAVDGVGFRIRRGETFCLVGESGCGKSVTALSIMRLLPSSGKIISGESLFEGQDLLQFSEREMRSIRGRRISMIFQEPMTSLNPVFTIGTQIMEALTAHLRVSRRGARRMAFEMLEKVRIPEPSQRLNEYPHQMSGGMQQRVMIAMALACKPALLIADEPTTALDVTIQAQILGLLQELQHEMGMSVLLITHDLGVVAEVADRVAVMYAGQIVESADVKSVFRDPLHPYMVSLLKSLPMLGSREKRLSVIQGQVPDPRWFPTGCRFHPRCYMAVPDCALIEPELREVEPGHQASCIRLEGYWEEASPLRAKLAVSDAERLTDG